MLAHDDTLMCRVTAVQSNSMPWDRDGNYAILELQRPGDDQECLLLMLADDVRGHAGGPVASEIVLSAFVDAFTLPAKECGVPEAMRVALDVANEALADCAKSDPGLEGMGCTFVAVLVLGRKLHWISVGRSPIWQLRNGVLERINVSHSNMPLLEAMEGDSELGRMQLSSASGRNTPCLALDGTETGRVDQSRKGLALHPGDGILLASESVKALAESKIASTLKDIEPGLIDQSIQKLMCEIEAVARPEPDTPTILFLKASSAVGGSQKLSGETALQNNASNPFDPEADFLAPETNGGAGYVGKYVLPVLGLAGLLVVAFALYTDFIVENRVSGPHSGPGIFALENSMGADSLEGVTKPEEVSASRQSPADPQGAE